MYINRSQSIILSVIVIVTFFGAGTYFSNQQSFNQDAADTVATNVKANGDVLDSGKALSTVKKGKGGKRKRHKKQKDTALNSQDTPEKQDVSLTLDNFHRSEIRNGRKHWEIKAHQAVLDPKTGRTTVKTAEVWLYRENGDIIYLQSQNALLFLEGGIFKEAHLSTDIVLKINDELTLTANKAHYDHAKQTVEVPGHVTITGDLYHITGRKLLADLTTEEFTLVKDVDSTITPQSSKEGA